MIRRLMLYPLATTTDRERAERSVWLWGEWQGGWFLTPLGVVNTVRGWIHLRPITMRSS